jgi:glycosyltransferase involved in cell wall biosynthesis
MKNNHTIVYINFSPYDNAGRILDFLISNYAVVIHFSYDHLRLKNGRNTNILSVYEHGKISLQRKLIPLRTPELLRFPSLPAVAFLIFLQTLYYAWRFKLKYHRIDQFMSVNAYTAWIGNILKKFHIVKKTIFWVWDYYPPGYADWRIRLLRWVYWKFDKPAVRDTDHLAFISKKLVMLRQKLGVLSKIRIYDIIPIGTNPTTRPLTKRKLIIGFLGMLKKSQGLDFLFDVLPLLVKTMPNIKIECIGSGPEENYFKKRAKRWKKYVTLLGFIKTEDEVDKIMRRWIAGLAMYVPDASNESYWADPSKIKAYLSQYVPVVMTNVPSFATEVVKNNAGIIVEYNQTQQLIDAIKTIHLHWDTYAKNAYKLAQKYHYAKLYRNFLKTAP